MITVGRVHANVVFKRIFYNYLSHRRKTVLSNVAAKFTFTSKSVFVTKNRHLLSHNDQCLHNRCVTSSVAAVEVSMENRVFRK